MFSLLRFCAFFIPDDGSGGAGGGGSTDPTPPANTEPTQTEPNAGGGTSPADSGKTFTQAELDDILGKRLARERKTWEQQSEAERKKAQMSEAEQLKAAKEEADKKAQDAIAAANQRSIKSEAKVTAIRVGIKAERVDAALRLADLSDISVGDDGEPDSKGIETALKAVLKDYPEFAAGAGNNAGGGDFSKPNPGDEPLTEELIKTMDSKELQRRMPEIQAYLAAKRKKS